MYQRSNHYKFVEITLFLIIANVNALNLFCGGKYEDK